MEEGASHRDLIAPEDSMIEMQSELPSNLKGILKRRNENESNSLTIKTVKWSKEVDVHAQIKAKKMKKANKQVSKKDAKQLDGFVVSDWTLRIRNTAMQSEY